jgi:hypothetical protein
VARRSETPGLRNGQRENLEPHPSFSFPTAESLTNERVTTYQMQQRKNRREREEKEKEKKKRSDR